VAQQAQEQVHALNANQWRRVSEVRAREGTGRPAVVAIVIHTQLFGQVHTATHLFPAHLVSIALEPLET
jgi:hypothetical protein